MKLTAILLSCLITSSILAAGNRQLECTGSTGGYDVETVRVTLDGNSRPAALEYDSYQSPVGPFVAADPAIAPNTFEFTEKDLEIREIITVSKDLRHAILLTVYKKSGSVARALEFDCR